MNKVILVGNAGADGELKVTQGGNAVLKIRLATSESWKDKNGNKQEKTEWHSCQLWGERAEKLAQYITKGTKLAITGSIRYSEYEKDGEKRYRTDINVDDLEFVGGGKGKKDGGGGGDDIGDRIPF